MFRIGTLSHPTGEERPGGRGYRIVDLETLGALGAMGELFKAKQDGAK